MAYRTSSDKLQQELCQQRRFTLRSRPRHQERLVLTGEQFVQVGECAVGIRLRKPEQRPFAYLALQAPVSQHGKQRVDTTLSRQLRQREYRLFTHVAFGIVG